MIVPRPYIEREQIMGEVYLKGRVETNFIQPNIRKMVEEGLLKK